MYLIEVVPLARLPRLLPDTFSYFSATPISKGVVVEIEVKQRKLFGIVLSSQTVKESKQELRTASFMLKKVGRILSDRPIFNQRDWAFLRWFSLYHLVPPATVMRMMLPSFVFRRAPPIGWEARSEIISGESPSHDLYLGAPPLSDYREAATRALEAEAQTLIIVPDILRGQKIAEDLQTHCTPNTVHLIHSAASQPMLRHTWHHTRTGKPLVLIGARLPLFYPFLRLHTIILDDDGAPGHKSWEQEPRYQARTVVRKLHELHNGRLIITGTPPSIEAYQYFRSTSENFNIVRPAILHSPPVALLVEMEKEIKQEGLFVIISQVLKDKLRSVVLEGGRAFLFVNRRGFAPFILCQDCGEAIRCLQCSVPLVYHSQESFSSPTLLCHHCSSKNLAPDTCPHCGSHRLKPYGIGVERVAKEMRKIFPGVPVLTLSSDTIKISSRETPRIIGRLHQLSSYIAIGTELALSGAGLPQMELAAAVSLDTALSLPDYAQNERLYRLLALIRGLAKKFFILQSYVKEPEMLRDLFHGTFEHFLEKELKDRKRFGYPPHSQLVKLTVRNLNRAVALRDVKDVYRNLNFLQTKLGPEAIEVSQPYPAYVEKQKNNFIFHILVKVLDLERADELKAALASAIPPHASIDADPATLL